jgi:uncharacterized membrane protein
MKPLWSDELFSINFALNVLPSYNVFTEIWIDPHPPLYYLLLMGWIKIFGTSIFAVRFLSVLFHSLSIVSMYYFIETNYNQKMALSTLPLLEFNWILLYFAQETRMYSLIVLEFIWSTILFIRFKKDSTIKNGIFYALILILSLYTENLTWFLIGSQFIFGLFSLLIEKKLSIKSLFRLSIPYIITCLGIGFWIWKIIQSNNIQNMSWISWDITLKNLGGVYARLFGINTEDFDSMLIPMFYLVNITLILFFLISYKLKNMYSRDLTILLLIYLGMPIIFFLISKIIFPILFYRYLISYIPFFSLSLILGFEQIYKKNKVIAIGWYCLIIMVLLLSTINVFLSPTK